MNEKLYFINSLLASPVGWEILIQDRIEKAIKELELTNIILYPELAILKEFHAYGKVKYIMYSTHWLLLNTEKIRAEGSKIIFPSVFQMPILQMTYGGLVDFDYEVLLHCNRDAMQYKPFTSSGMILDYSDSIRNKIFQTKATADTYSVLGQNKVIGGFLNSFEMYSKENYVLWTGYRVGDETKDYEKFLKIVKKNGNLQFVACLNQRITTIGYPNLKVLTGLDSYEFLDICRKAKYVLSTSRTDSFSYSLFDAISFGAIPIVSDIPPHREWIPEKFIYIDEPDFSVKAEPEEMKKIVDYHYYADTFLRMIK